MTPRRLNRDAVIRRLDRMSEVLDLLRTIGEPTADQLRDLALRSQVEWAIERLVELAVNINLHVVSASAQRPPADYAESFHAAAQVGLIPADLAEELRPAVGLRNVVVHEYLEVDLAQVAAALPRAVAGFTAYRDAVAQRLVGLERRLDGREAGEAPGSS